MSDEVVHGRDGDPSPSPGSLHGLVEAQARCRPERPAVIDGARALTFGELDRRADLLARHLRGLGVTSDVGVALCCARSIEMAVGFLGILKAGGTCVPLDPTHPRARLRFVVDDADVRVVVTQHRLAGLLRSPHRVTVCMDLPWESPSADLPGVVDSDSLAYVLYTSGSTGRPKGVALTHGGL